MDIFRGTFYQSLEKPLCGQAFFGHQISFVNPARCWKCNQSSIFVQYEYGCYFSAVIKSFWSLHHLLLALLHPLNALYHAMQFFFCLPSLLPQLHQFLHEHILVSLKSLHLQFRLRLFDLNACIGSCMLDSGAAEESFG